MKPLYVLLVGVAVGWAASGVDWSREAVGQDGGVGQQEGESVRQGALRRRGLLPQRDGATPTPSTDAPAFSPDGDPATVPVTVARTVVDSEGRTITVYEQHRRASDPGRTSAAANPIGRFQATAYGSASGNGCYVVDSTTGQTWLIRNGQQPEVVAKTLLDQALAAPLVAPPEVQYGEPVLLPGPPTPQAN